MYYRLVVDELQIRGGGMGLHTFAKKGLSRFLFYETAPLSYIPKNHAKL